MSGVPLFTTSPSLTTRQTTHPLPLPAAASNLPALCWERREGRSLSTPEGCMYVRGQRWHEQTGSSPPLSPKERELFIDELLVRIHWIIAMIR